MIDNKKTFIEFYCWCQEVKMAEDTLTKIVTADGKRGRRATRISVNSWFNEYYNELAQQNMRRKVFWIYLPNCQLVLCFGFGSLPKCYQSNNNNACYCLFFYAVTIAKLVLVPNDFNGVLCWFLLFCVVIHLVKICLWVSE